MSVFLRALRFAVFMVAGLCGIVFGVIAFAGREIIVGTVLLLPGSMMLWAAFEYEGGVE